MFDYLVTSKVRRRLLSLLWEQNARGSAAELAERASVAFASAHDELNAMQRLQLVASQRDGGKEVYYANPNHPAAECLRTLVNSDTYRSGQPSDSDKTLKRQLKALGAPLRGVEPLEVSPSSQLETLLKGVELARRDPVVARTLPLSFWKLRDSLNAKELKRLTLRPEDKHATGFFLELTSELSGDRRLLGLAEALRDDRMKSVRDFFQLPVSTRQQAPLHSFPLAEKWGFQMRMDLESFRSLFDKFARKSDKSVEG
jgi:hypothetical protein